MAELCRSTADDMRCELPDSHTGPHYSISDEHLWQTGDDEGVEYGTAEPEVTS